MEEVSFPCALCDDVKKRVWVVKREDGKFYCPTCGMVWKDADSAKRFKHIPNKINR